MQIVDELLGVFFEDLDDGRIEIVTNDSRVRLCRRLLEHDSKQAAQRKTVI
jgi:hypothetical protein